MDFQIQSLDHLVLTVGDIDRSIAFYRDVLGMRAERFLPNDGSERWAICFGAQKINLHQSGAEFEPKAAHATPGSADLCFLSAQQVADWAHHLAQHGVLIVDGPVRRTGAQGAILSIYVRDPDGNLIEISNQV